MLDDKAIEDLVINWVINELKKYKQYAREISDEEFKQCLKEALLKIVVIPSFMDNLGFGQHNRDARIKEAVLRYVVREYGFDINQRSENTDESKILPIIPFFLLEKGMKPSVKYLFEHGGLKEDKDFWAYDKQFGGNILHFAATDPELFALVNDQVKKRNTNPKILQAALRQVNKSNQTPLDVAQSFNNNEAIEIIEKYILDEEKKVDQAKVVDGFGAALAAIAKK